nr:immunoglobulin light chain junction region [Macaca mulatta]MOX17807.1 immunoglobulin light chain junction region [Macaca mulatta]MOX18267.1 immunoglobulin light chain junction region [Macaca mulatta]MOX18425.1 immunoglobulin light chain junction region [Macaca mulatta]MOX18477.1 immunoglobulin light chain junction region [Macaca mulatta]
DYICAIGHSSGDYIF